MPKQTMDRTKDIYIYIYITKSWSEPQKHGALDGRKNGSMNKMNDR